MATEIRVKTTVLPGGRCELFVTDDSGFHRISNLSLSVLSEMVP